MPYFDRFDICAAYNRLERDYNIGGMLQERPTCRRRGQSVGVQLARMQYREFTAHEPTENEEEIYNAAARRFKLPQTCHRCTTRQTDPSGIGYASHLCEKCATDALNMNGN